MLIRSPAKTSRWVLFDYFYKKFLLFLTSFYVLKYTLFYYICYNYIKADPLDFVRVGLNVFCPNFSTWPKTKLNYTDNRHGVRLVGEVSFQTRV